MRKILYPILIFAAILSVSARAVRAADEPKNPARSKAEHSGVPFDIKLSSATKAPAEDFRVSPATAAVKPADMNAMPAVQAQPAPATVAPELQKAKELLAAGDWRDARQTSLKYLEANGKSSDAWTVLAKTYAAQKKYAKAVRRFDKALKYGPHNAEAFYGKGMAFEAMGKMDEAANEYQAAFRADITMTDARTAWQRVKNQVSVAP